MSTTAPQALVEGPRGGERRVLPLNAHDPEPVNAVALVNAVLRYRAPIVTVSLLAAVLVFAWKLTRPRSYVSQSSFSVQSSDQRSAFSGLAAQFGLAVPSAPGEQSSSFYVELVRSRPILENVASTRYARTVDGRVDSTSLAEVFRIRSTDTLDRKERVVRRLSSAVTAGRSRETGTVTMTVAAPSPGIAQQISQNLLAQLNEFNLRTRQSRASNERRFIEQRLANSRAELQQAEAGLESFLRRNRLYESSPDLTFQRERLSREVSLRQQLFTALAQNFEQARIDEVRDTPALTTIEQPSLPVRPLARGTISATLLTLVTVFLLACLVAVATVLLQPRMQTLSDDLDEYQRLRTTFLAELRRPWRLIGLKGDRG